MRLPSAAVGVALFALFAFTIAGTASALPVVLLESGTFPVKFEGKSSGSPVVIETASAGLKVECQQGKISGEITASNAGTYKLDIEKCVIFGKECHTSGDVSGVLLWSGELHFVRVSLSPVKVAMLLSLTPAVSSCLGEFSAPRGYLVPITPINAFTTFYELKPRLVGTGVEEFTSYYNAEGELVNNVFLTLATLGGFGWQVNTINVTTERKIEIFA